MIATGLVVWQQVWLSLAPGSEASVVLVLSVGFLLALPVSTVLQIMPGLFDLGPLDRISSMATLGVLLVANWALLGLLLHLFLRSLAARRS